MRWPLFVRRVEGHSMLPTLEPGKIVVASGLLKVTVGKIVIARHQGGEIVKRVASIQPEVVELTGDNSSSSHNAQVSPTAVIGVVL